ncbi:hypothetical protein H0H81_009197 [Sphagnurus paluster]|uniref:DUF5648 domain-containing protein n=1 Tax=Sphagnurus paluster TaxID=117069 RepID=A0A9P7FPI8_9AGAR|nr:hypothetical protein H0H81_009197 [Sphagnurus paluster]
MKFSLVILSALATFASASPSENYLEARAGAAQACGDPRVATPFYRSYNSRIVDHFYTTNLGEDRRAINSLGYSDEGISSYIFSRSQPGTVPLYRLYSSKASDHFYTTSSSERSSALTQGYVSEGISGWIYPNSDCGGFPLYRLYSSSGTDHFYTTSGVERNSAESGGYTSEGITGYVFPY